MLSLLLLTCLLATTGADESSGATKTILRVPLFTGSRFVVNEPAQQESSVGHAPVRAAASTSPPEGNVVLHQEVPTQPESVYYSGYPQYSDYSHRRYVPYVYSPYSPYYQASNGVPSFLPQSQQQSQVIELDAISSPLQILVRTPFGTQVYKPVLQQQSYNRPTPVHYFVGVFPSAQQQPNTVKSVAAQEQKLVTNVEEPQVVSSEVPKSETPSSPVSLASSGSVVVTETVPSVSGQSSSESKDETVTSDSF